MQCPQNRGTGYSAVSSDSKEPTDTCVIYTIHICMEVSFKSIIRSASCLFFFFFFFLESALGLNTGLYRWYKCYVVSEMISALRSALEPEPGKAGSGMREKCVYAHPLSGGSVGLGLWTLLSTHVHYPLKPHYCLSNRLEGSCFSVGWVPRCV